MERALERLGEGDEICVAVRSPAVEEDRAEHAFAGQLRSFLFVSPEDVGAKVAVVWRSVFTADVRAYPPGARAGREAQPPAVLVQRMVRADQGGVACLAIASAGGNPLALLTRHPECLVAIDLSSAQLHCLALR